MAGLGTVLLAFASGIFNGTFPVFIKTKAVLAADVHPIVFQFYKSLWVCILGAACALVRLARGLPLEFTLWAFLSAAAWIPSGVCTIIAVPRIGVGSSVLTTAATGSALSFMVFWLCFHERMRTYIIGDTRIVLAPFYMIGCLAGMVALVFAHQTSLRASQKAQPAPAQTATGFVPSVSLSSPESSGEDVPQDRPDRLLLSAPSSSAPTQGSSPVPSLHRTLLGYASAAFSGVFSALQYGLVSVGQRESGMAQGTFDERFDALGSWLALFGASALLCTLVAWAAVAALNTARGLPVPTAKLNVMWLPGSAAGIFWSAASVCATFAVLRGGNAVTTAQINAASLITSGAWGLVWYREIRGRPALWWIAAAIFTATMAILLGNERQGAGHPGNTTEVA